MSQADLDIANISRSLVRAEINASLQALASNSSGASEPATTYPFQLWADTSSGDLKQRNEANTDWIVLFQLSTGQLAQLVGMDLTGAINHKRSTVAATSTTTPLFAAGTGNVQDWTGTPTITNFPAAPQAGASRVVYPAAGTVITNAGNISVQGNANRTAEAGEEWTIRAVTTTTFYVTIKKKNGESVNVAPAFSAYAASSQSITSGVVTKVTLGTELFDTNNNFASSRFTPTVEGYYQITGQIRGQATNGTVWVAYIYKNGAVYKQGGTLASGATTFSNGQVSTVSDVIYMNGTTDYLELYGSVSGTTPVFEFVAASNTSIFSGVLVRAL